MSPESNLKRFYRVKQGVKSCSCGVIHKGERVGSDSIVSAFRRVLISITTRRSINTPRYRVSI